MNSAHRRPGRSFARRAPRFDRLEARLALSTASSSVVVVGSPTPGGPDPGGSGGLVVLTTDPASGSTIARAPASLKVTFNRPIIGNFSSGDLRLDRVAPDGTEAPIDGGSGLVESLGNSSQQLSVTPAAALGPGHYRLYLLGSSPLAGRAGADRMIDDFTIAAPGPDIGTAVDLGSPVSDVLTAAGSLDLAHDPTAADFYRVELPQGHFWRLGVEVDAQRIGSALLSTLTIYDAEGNAVASRVERPPDFPEDRYVFLGLDPGVYYIGVSGRTDLPAGTASSGGSFRLRVVADPADAPTTVVSSQVNYADPTEDIPTGLTLRFNGPLDGSLMAGSATDLIQVVDASGRAWAADAVAYDSSTSAVTFVFAQQLPPGQYSVRLAGQGGLVDLVGKPPVAPGMPAGTLADFTVDPTTVKRGPDDYGPIFLDQLRGGITAKSQLAPGEEVTYRFVLTAEWIDDLETMYSGSAPTFTVHADGASVSLAPGTGGLAQNHLIRLKPGVVTFDVKGGPLGTTIDWSFLLENGSYDLLLDNGVGQSSGLGLRLVAPISPDPQPAAPAGLGPTAAASTAATPPSSAPGSNNPGTPTVPSGSAGFSLAANVALVGHPSALDNAVAVVGPVTPSGMTALTTSVVGIPQGLTAGFGRGSQAAASLNSGAIQGLVEVPEAPDLAADAAPGLPLPIADLPPLPEVPGETAGPIEVAQAGGPIERLTSLLAGLVPSGPRVTARPGPAARDDVALAEVGGPPDPAVPEVDGAFESADVSGPLGLGVMVVAGVHYFRRLGNRLGRRKARAIRLVHGPSPSGPRRPTD
jgi:methionine-rich copper-binding protein CopC